MTPALVKPFNPIYDVVDGQYVVHLEVWHYYDGRRGRCTVPLNEWSRQDEMLVFTENVRWSDQAKD